MTILLIEDERKLAQAIKQGLELEHMNVDVVYDGAQGLKQGLQNEYDVIILDLRLPEKDGLDVCRELRERGVTTPIIVLSARAEMDDRVKGLDAGADDYITKPFGFQELLARIRSVMRRPPKTAQPTLSVGDLTLDPATREVTRAGKKIELTPKEYALLHYLMRYPGEALTREQLLNHVWGVGTTETSNKLDVCVRYLRTKVDEPFDKKLIQTVRGAGYTIKA